MPDLGRLPHNAELAALLAQPLDSHVQTQIEQTLIKPLDGYLSKSGKRFRSQILEIGFHLADEGRTPKATADALCEKGTFLIEMIHAASMVVDDIEDQSEQRRGQPAFYRQVGLPVALNAGNWLYFWPLERIKTWGLAPERELAVYRLCHSALLRAHFGQALDVGVPIDSVPQDKVWETCLASLELKTGALMGLAADLGGALAGADAATVKLLHDFGVAFGITLQMFDDISNLLPGTGPLPDPKQYEDLKLRRPSWVWACAAHASSDQEYARLIEAVRHLPDPTWVEAWLDRQALPMRAKAMAVEHLDGAFGPLEERLGSKEKLSWLREIGDKLKKAYG